MLKFSNRYHLREKTVINGKLKCEGKGSHLKCFEKRLVD